MDPSGPGLPASSSDLYGPADPELLIRKNRIDRRLEAANASGGDVKTPTTPPPNDAAVAENDANSDIMDNGPYFDILGNGNNGVGPEKSFFEQNADLLGYQAYYTDPESVLTQDDEPSLSRVKGRYDNVFPGWQEFDNAARDIDDVNDLIRRYLGQ